MKLSFALCLVGLGLGCTNSPQAPVDSVASNDEWRVLAFAETEPVPEEGDIADDPAIWIDESDPSQSFVIGTNKSKVAGGLHVYDLSGRERQFLPSGRLNNVDVRVGVGAEGLSIAAASNRTVNGISVFAIEDGRLRELTGSPVPTSIKVYGFCLFKSLAGQLFGYVSSKEGMVQQYRLEIAEDRVSGALVREIKLASKVEGMAADDASEVLYIGEEEKGLWRVSARAGASATPTLFDGLGDHLTADVEGVDVYRRADGTGYIVASSQGSNDYALYDLATHSYVGRFAVVDGVVDGTAETDGVAVTSRALGPDLPEGLFVAQDGFNDEGNQNFKLVSWADLPIVD